MFDVIFVADFPLARTGIVSTATGILSNIDSNMYRLFSDQNVAIGTKCCEPLIDKHSDIGSTVIFTHIEYSGLPRLLKQIPGAVVHVGDWPGVYWKSLAKNGRPLKGVLGDLRMRYRIRNLPWNQYFFFVSNHDTQRAREYGFLNAQHLPIGVTPPSRSLGAKLNTSSICFSGNFRFPPNREAALQLLAWVRFQPEYELHLVGFFAADFSGEGASNIFLHDSVPSVVDFLSSLRPVYVSPLRTGAGAKNKILEALVAGCPVIATIESLDDSTTDLPGILKFDDMTQLNTLLDQVANNSDDWLRTTSEIAENTARERSWRSVSHRFTSLVESGH